MSLVQLIEVGKRYQPHLPPVLHDVSLTLQRGEFVALMGPSGGGKSTLFNLIGTLDTPSTGQILLDGQPLHDLGDEGLSLIRRRKLGFVFQFFNLLDTLSVLENVLLPLELDGGATADQRRKAITLLEEVGLAHRLEHAPAQLSGGEMQRVAIARALIHEPLLLLADEPTGNLDSDNSERILQLLAQIHQRRGMTILMATHNAEAATYASRTLHLRDGQLSDASGAVLLSSRS